MKVKMVFKYQKAKNLLPMDCSKKETRRWSSSRMKIFLIKSSDVQEEMSTKESKSEFGRAYYGLTVWRVIITYGGLKLYGIKIW